MGVFCFFFLNYLAGVELDESLLPKMVLYCGGPPGGAASKHFTHTHTPKKSPQCSDESNFKRSNTKYE